MFIIYTGVETCIGNSFDVMYVTLCMSAYVYIYVYIDMG